MNPVTFDLKIIFKLIITGRRVVTIAQVINLKGYRVEIYTA